MKRIHLSSYQLPLASRLNFAALNIFVLSDVHFSYQVLDSRLAALANFIKRQSPDYIFIPGDLIDSANMLDSLSEQARLLDFVNSLGQIAPTIISIGNHDFYRSPSPTHVASFKPRQWQIVDNAAFRAKLRALPHVHLLDNDIYEDDRIYVLGYTQSAAYYNFKTTGKDRTRLFHPSHELTTVMSKELAALPNSYLKNLPKNKLKFALIHSPAHLQEAEISRQLHEFDFYISGHMHNGVVPPVLNEIWPSHHGLVSPTRNIFPPFARGTARLAQQKSIITGAVTTFHECSGPAHHLNALYPTYCTLLNFSTNHPSFRLHKKYYRFNKKSPAGNN